MAYNEELAARVREMLVDVPKVEEKKMMGGLTFMVNNKMCVGVLQEDLMVRINPDVYETSLEKNGCREMNFTGKAMKGFVFIGPEGTSKKKDMSYWIDLGLAYNPLAKASPKKKKKK